MGTQQQPQPQPTGKQQPAPQPAAPAPAPQPALDRFQTASRGLNSNTPPVPAANPALTGAGNPNSYAQGPNFAGGQQYSSGKPGKPQPAPQPGGGGGGVDPVTGKPMRPPTPDGIGQPPQEAPPPVDFAAGFDPSKSIWGENGRNAYMSDKANEYFRTQASGSKLFDQWQQINGQNPLAARAFRHSVMGMGGGQNDFENQLLARGFGGDTAKYNEYRNAAHSAGQEGLEGGFNLMTGKWDTQRADQPAYQVRGWNPAAFR